MVRIPGSWSSFDHLEESLTLDELMLLFEKVHKAINDDRTFAASLKGIDLRDDTSESDREGGQRTFEDIKRDAAAKARGISTDEMEFGDIGIGFVEVDE